MQRLLNAAKLSICLTVSLAAQQPTQLVGTWNVTCSPTSDFTVNPNKVGASIAYIWLVSTTANGEIQVSVQGETAFKTLKGRWQQDSRTLILEGRTTGFGGNTACWFKLTLDRNGELRGVRRYMDSSPSFADFQVIAKKS